MTNYIGVLFWN